MGNPTSLARLIISKDFLCRICKSNLGVNGIKPTNGKIFDHLRAAAGFHTQNFKPEELSQWIEEYIHEPTAFWSSRFRDLSDVSREKLRLEPGLICPLISSQVQKELFRVSTLVRDFCVFQQIVAGPDCD